MSDLGKAKGNHDEKNDSGFGSMDTSEESQSMELQKSAGFPDSCASGSSGLPNFGVSISPSSATHQNRPAKTLQNNSSLDSANEGQKDSDSESGYGSATGSLTSAERLSLLNKELLHDEEEEPSVLSSSTEGFEGTPQDFLEKLSDKKWQKWDPVLEIKNLLIPKLLNELRLALWEQDDNGEFDAFCAAREGDENVVALSVFVCDHHKQLNTMTKQRQTILHMAAAFCSAQLVRLIITRGADGAVPDVWGDTPLHIAAEKGRADVIKALTTTLTKPEVKHPYFRVPYKSLPQDNVQSYNHDGRAPVHLAAQTANSKEHRDALRALAKHARADMDFRRLGDGYAPSHIAIDNGDIDCLRTCLEMGADSEVRNYKSETPQQLAYLCNYERMVYLCQKFGAGAYQLDYARTEPVVDDMEVEDAELSEQMEHMAM